MNRFPIIKPDNDAPDGAINKIQDGALGVAILFSEEPTTSNGICPEMEFGFYLGNFYYQIEGSCYKVTGTLVP